MKSKSIALIALAAALAAFGGTQTTKEYVDTQDAATLAAGKAYSDAKAVEVEGKMPSTNGFLTASWTNNTRVVIGNAASAAGENGVAIGKEAGANGGHSLAFGEGSKALGVYSLSFGNGATANDDNDVAIGAGSVASNANAFAVGSNAKALGVNSVAVGNNSTVKNLQSAAIGFGAITKGDNSSAIGVYAEAVGSNSVAVGTSPKSHGAYSTAVGANAVASNDYSVAIGNAAKAVKEGTIAIGRGASSSGEGSCAIGKSSNSTNENSFAFGVETKAQGANSFAAGFHSVSKGNDSIAIGNYANSIGPKSIMLGQGSAWGEESIGIGRSCVATDFRGIAIGYYNWAQGEYATSVGNETKANGSYACAVGNGSEASGNDSVAVGNESFAIGNKSVSLGVTTLANGNYSISIGNQASVYGNYSTAIGYNADVHAYKATAIGYGSKATGQGSMAIGSGASATNWESIVIGNGTASTSNDTLRLGFNIGNIIVGKGTNAIPLSSFIGGGGISESRVGEIATNIVTNVVTRAYVEGLGISVGSITTNFVSGIVTNHVASGYLCTAAAVAEMDESTLASAKSYASNVAASKQDKMSGGVGTSVSSNAVDILQSDDEYSVSSCTFVGMDMTPEPRDFSRGRHVLTVPGSFGEAAYGAQSWEATFKFTYEEGGDPVGYQVLFSDGMSYETSFGVCLGTLKAHLSNGNYFADTAGLTQLSFGHLYWAKLSFDGSRYLGMLSTNGTDYSEEFVVSNATRVSRGQNNVLTLGVKKYNGSFRFVGTIYLDSCGIVIDGSDWWNPSASSTGVAKATDTLYGLVKPDGVTTTVSNGILSAVAQGGVSASVVTGIVASASVTNEGAVAAAAASAAAAYLPLAGGTLAGDLTATNVMTRKVTFNDWEFEMLYSADGMNFLDYNSGYSSFLVPDDSNVATSNMVGRMADYALTGGAVLKSGEIAAFETATNLTVTLDFDDNGRGADCGAYVENTAASNVTLAVAGDFHVAYTGDAPLTLPKTSTNIVYFCRVKTNVVVVSRSEIK